MCTSLLYPFIYILFPDYCDNGTVITDVRVFLDVLTLVYSFWMCWLWFLVFGYVDFGFLVFIAWRTSILFSTEAAPVHIPDTSRWQQLPFPCPHVLSVSLMPGCDRIPNEFSLEFPCWPEYETLMEVFIDYLYVFTWELCVLFTSLFTDWVIGILLLVMYFRY